MLPTHENIAELFHRRTSIQAGPGMPMAEPTDPHLPLPLALPLVEPASAPSLEQAIVARRTGRAFDPQAELSVPTLSRLIVLSLGHTSSDAQGLHRAVPSAGASYPVDAYLIVQRVAGLEPGVYAYDAFAHEISLRRRGQFPLELTIWTLDQPWMAHAPVLVALVGTLGRLQERYASRGYRYMLLEAGHVAQNLCLLGVSLGYCVQAGGGFVDSAMDKFLALPPGTRTLYLLALGPGDLNAPLPVSSK
jgi:SagB-type dehydrogenase family enzyme